MVRPITPIPRPPCPQGHPGRIWLDGRYGRSWSEHHYRVRFTCIPANGAKRHRFTFAEAMRAPSASHPHSGDACPHCEHTYFHGEGPRTGPKFTFTYAEAALALVCVGRGMSFRETSRQVRKQAHRYETVPRGERRLRAWSRDRRDHSREAQLAAGYVDVLAPFILDHFQADAWPEAIAIDSIPIRKRRFNPGGPRYGGDANGEVLMAVGYQSQRTARPLAVKVAGNKDNESWAEFFRSLKGQPQWVVADRDSAITKAVEDVWPGTVLYSCEGHLMMNMRDAAAKDRIPQWVRDPAFRPPPPGARLDMYPYTSKAEKQYETHPVWDAIETAQRSPEHWERLKTLLSPKAKRLRKWMSDNEPLVLGQMELRKQHPTRPRGTGRVEVLAEAFRRALVGRSGRFSNARRLEKVLRLVALQQAGEASEIVYSGLIRELLRKQRPRMDWAKWRDAADQPSIDRLIFEADLRSAKGRARVEAERRAKGQRRRFAEAEERRLDAGQPSHWGRKRRPGAAARDTYRSIKGKLVCDFADLIGYWHPTRNEEHDPFVLPASHKGKVWWLCPVHPSHEWEASVIGRATHAFGCPFCLNRKVSVTNSLATMAPDLAAEWHPTKNGTLTPDDVMPGTNKLAWWKCPKRGHVYRAEIAVRAKQLTGCKKCAVIDNNERLRQTESVRGKKMRRLARLAHQAVDQPPEGDPE